MLTSFFVAPDLAVAYSGIRLVLAYAVEQRIPFGFAQGRLFRFGRDDKGWGGDLPQNL